MYNITMLLLVIITLVLTIPLASIYLSTILIHGSAFLILIYNSILSYITLYIIPLSSGIGILGGLFQSSILSQGSNIILLTFIPIIINSNANSNILKDNKQIIKEQISSTRRLSLAAESLIKYNNILKSLTSEFKQWFVGFLDAEGCFMIISRSLNNRITLKVEINLHIDELPLLKILQTKLNCGVIFEGKSKCQLTINKQSDLSNIIIPILEEFPLNTTKYLNYLDFKEALNIMQSKGHLTANGKLQILKLKANMNRLRTNYEIPPEHTINITPSWFLGFIEGDGSFTTTKSMPFLSISQSIKDIAVLKKISEYFNSGTLKEQKITNRYKNEKPMFRLIFHDIIFLHNILLPLFNSLEFYSKKQLDYKDWVIIVKLYFSGIHLYPQGEKLISDLKMNMNNNRLSTSENIIDKPIITQEMINGVLSLEPLYQLVDSKRVHIKSNKPLRSGRMLKITAMNIDNSSIEFNSIKEASEFFKCHTDTISRRLNSERLYLNKWKFITN